MRESQKISQYNSDKNELNDKLALLRQQLLFLKSEKYEAEKWAIKANKAFVDAYKDLRVEKRAADQGPEYISILEEQVTDTRKSRDEVKQNIIDIEKSIDVIEEYIKKQEKLLGNLQLLRLRFLL